LVRLLQYLNRSGKFVIPALIIAYISTWFIEVLNGVYLLDMTQTFLGIGYQPSIPVGTSPLLAAGSQLVAIATIAAVISGILLGALCTKVSHDKLFLFGIVAVAVGTLGCFLAPNWVAMQIFFSVVSIGTIIITAMTFTLVGEVLPLHRRPIVTGFILAVAPVASIITALVIINFSATDLALSDPTLPIGFAVTGWRSFLGFFALPVTLISLVAAYLGVPKVAKIGSQNLKVSFGAVFLSRSAVGCLVGNMVRQAVMVMRVFYIPSFFRETFLLSLNVWVVLMLASVAVFALGSIVGGYLINRVGRKRLLVASLIVSSPFLLPLAFWANPNLMVLIPLMFVGSFIFSMGSPSSINLTLEQVSKARGTMMSMSAVFVTLGVSLGTILGGLVLRTFESYTALMLAFVALELVAVAVYSFLTKDPTKEYPIKSLV
jgi:MFS family permease